MKGKNAENELKAARKAIPLLGGRLVSSDQDTLTNGTEGISRFTVVIQKVTDTPAAYPRPYAKILKSPL